MNLIKSSGILLSTIISCSLILGACKKKPEDEVAPEESFDKSGMLANIGDNLIMPAYAEFRVSVDSLQFYTNAFIANPNAATLNNLQMKLMGAYTEYQYCSVYEFGPAETEYFRASFNTFPCDTTEINAKITAGDYVLTTAEDLDVKGFPALDFLVEGTGNGPVLAKFTTSPDAANAKNYLAAVVAEIAAKTNSVYNGWSPASGNYISTFKGNTGNDVGGSIGLLVNQLNFDLELLKNAKVGIPLGKKTLGVPQPEKVESYYDGASTFYAYRQLLNLENIYLGRNREGTSDGLGLDDYLTHVDAQYGSGTLNDAIRNKFTSAKNKMLLIPGRLSDAVVASPAIVDAAYVELQQLVILLKVDMPSALGVSITYVDNDGD